MDKIAVFLLSGYGFAGMEGETAKRVARHLVEKDKERRMDVFETDKDCSLRINDLIVSGGYEAFCVIKDNVFITAGGIEVLARIALNKTEFAAVGPVSNESKILQQRHSPPFLYQTPTVFEWAADGVYREHKERVIGADEIDDFCFVTRRDLLENMPEDLPVIDLPEVLKKNGLRQGIARGIYANCYRNCYESGREDLMAYVPLTAQKVLDVGCARGLFGDLLKRRQKCSVTGIDSDYELLAATGERLDKILHGNIEELVENGNLGVYDCIVCGDVIEHLSNPWKVLKGLRNHLSQGGLVIASTPNINNWAIIYDMLKGRWDYVPFSILSGTHIRFFTRQTLTELFEHAGYRVLKTIYQCVGAPPEGRKFIKSLQKTIPDLSEDDLNASEIVIVADA